MRVTLALSLAAAAALAAGLAFTYAGLADVAATSSHFAVTRWILSTSMERSVKRAARGVTAPEWLDDDARMRAGALEYDAMCAGCHGAPGVEPGVVGRGLNPEPPDLAKTGDTWSAAEVFWITEHGVRMTGMPAFGPTHSADALWELAAFVKRLPRLSAAEYHALVPAHAEHEHMHGHVH